MYATHETYEQGRQSPAHSAKMDIHAITHMESFGARRSSEDLQMTSVHKPYADPQTPPDSTSGSPQLKLEPSFPDTSRYHSTLPQLTHQNPTIRNTSIVRLPSLEEFDLGVEALARSYGPAPSPPPRPSYSATHSPTQTLPSLHSYINPDQYHGYHVGDSFMSISGSMDGYPSPPPDGENRHINQKYTTEEGDFIIYAWHDKKLKWQRIKQDFASMFGRTPERTVQGLQAWYYRMNQRIPLWDQEGWLIFDNEEDLEPKQISIKCRERDSQDKPMEPLGLAQRYPERAIHYSWVDAEMKRQCRDWASKRSLQYRERKERRKRKEQRRMKL